MSLLSPHPFYNLRTNWSQSGTFESQSNLAGTDLFIEIHRVLAAVRNIEPANISQMAHESEPKSNADHGTDDLDLPIQLTKRSSS